MAFDRRMEMGGSKVVYLDEYRKKRLNRQRSLREMIEGHLAEAGLMEKDAGVGKTQKGAGAQVCDKTWPSSAVEEDAG